MSLFNQSWSRQMASPMRDRARPALSGGWRGGMNRGFGFNNPTTAATLPTTSEMAPQSPAMQNQGMAVAGGGMAPQSYRPDMTAVTKTADIQEPPGGLLTQINQAPNFSGFGALPDFMGAQLEDGARRKRFGFGGGSLTGPTFTFTGNA